MSKVTNKNKLIAKMMEDIFAMSSDKLEVKKFGKKWVFRQLTTAEHVETINNSQSDDMVTRIYKLQIETLKRALVSIDGVEFSLKDADSLFTNVVPTVGDVLFVEYDRFRNEKNDELEKLSGVNPSESSEVQESGEAKEANDEDDADSVEVE